MLWPKAGKSESLETGILVKTRYIVSPHSKYKRFNNYYEAQKFLNKNQSDYYSESDNNSYLISECEAGLSSDERYLYSVDDAMG